MQSQKHLRLNVPIFSMLYHDIICHTSESSYYKQPVVKGLYFLMHATVFIYLNFWNGHIKPDIRFVEWKKKSCTMKPYTPLGVLIHLYKVTNDA